MDLQENEWSGRPGANRRTSLTLPNGIVLAYTSYDGDSRVKGMTWTLSGNPVGDLEYNYDADERVIGKTGSFAQTNLPQTVTGNMFNAANEMTAFNGTPLSYDANGNLTNDGTNAYAWDARNHLTGISGAANASFIYDGLGRRMGKSIGGNVTQFLYDRLNPVQELDASNAPSANLLTGLRIDEYFQRTDTSGTSSYLADALGSTLALANSVGGLSTSYTSDPFGNTTVAGSSSNPYQFTGRENDGTGLYFYRARYYSPTLQRFIAQDPIGFAGGGPNLYAFVENNPANLVDRLGLQVMPEWADPDSPEYDPIDWGAVGDAASNPSNQLTAPPSDSGYYCALKPSPPPPPDCPAGATPPEQLDPIGILTGLGGYGGFEAFGPWGAGLGAGLGLGIGLWTSGQLANDCP